MVLIKRFSIMRLELVRWRIHGASDTPCICNAQWTLQEIGSWLEQLHDWFFPQLPSGSLPWEGSLEETIFCFFFWETPFDRYGCFSEVFWEGKQLLNIVSQKLISYDFVLPLCCTKWKGPLEGSRCKLIELTCVSRFLAYDSVWVGPM